MKSLRKVWNLIRYAAGISLFLVLVVVGLTQSKTFRTQLRIVLLSRLQTVTTGEVQFGAITGNLLTNVSLSDVQLRMRGEDVFRARKLTVEYNPWRLLQNKISIRNVIMEAPELTLRRSPDRRWNIEELLPQKQDTHEVSAELSEPWDVELRGFQVRDGMLLVLDSSSVTSDTSWDGGFRTDHFAIIGLNAQVSGEITRDIVRAKIVGLEFQLPRPEVTVKQIRGNIDVETNFVNVEDFFVETDRSLLSLKLRVDQFDWKNFNLKSLERSSTVVELNAENIDFKELKSFIPALSFLEGGASVNLAAKGNLGALEIEKLDLRTRNSLLHFKGTVSNLHEPNRLILSVNAYNNEIDPKDVVQLLPGFSIPDLGHLGTVRMDLEFKGRPLVFDSNILLQTVAGNVETDVRFDFSKPVAEYHGSIRTKELSLGTVFQADNLVGPLTMAGSVDGKGFALENLNSICRIEVDTSQIGGLTLEAGKIRLQAKRGRFDLALSLASQDTRVNGGGSVVFAYPDSTAYLFEASFTSLDLSTILRDSKHISDLSFLVNAEGWARSVEELSGKLTVSISPSVYRDRSIDQAEASLVFDQADPLHKVLSIRSDIIDADIEGQFDLRGIVDLIEEDTRHLIGILDRKLAPLDSVLTATSPKQTASLDERVESKARNPLERSGDYDFRFTANIKDLEPLALFLGGEKFDGRADLSGTIAGPASRLSLSIDGHIDDFFYGSIQEGAFLGKLRLHAAFEGLSPEMHMKDLRSEITVGGKSLFIGRTEFSDISLSLLLADEQLTTALSTTIDSMFFVSLNGNAAVGRTPYRLVLDSVRVGSGKYEWQSHGPVIATLDKTMLSAEQIAFVRGPARIRMSGSLNQDGTLELQGDLPKIDIGSLLSVLQQEPPSLRRTLQGSANLSFTVAGAIESPIITAQLALDDLEYRGVPLGMMRSTARYRDRMATLDIQFLKDSTSADAPELSVIGTLPIDLSLRKTGTSAKRLFSDLPMELRLRAHDFPLAFLDPLLADFDDIQGSVTGEINVQGTPEAPVYTGLVSTEDLRFMFVRNRLYYVMSATLQPEGENIRIVSMEIKNDREDRPDGVMVVSGMLTLKEFSVSSFDFSTQGKLLILSERMQKSAQEIQGNLFASIGPEGLHFTGTFDRSRLTGTISIESANILFPAVQQTVYTGSPTSLNYVVVDDTSKATSGASALARYQRGSDTVESAGDFEDGASTRTIFDGVSYDVRIETKGDAEIRMIFDPVTGEELLAVLNGKLAMVRDGQQTQLLGEVTVAERSFYSFYKKFDATGKLKFTGDPENPELDIKAKYEGIYEGQTKDKPDTTQTLTALVDLTITGTRYEPKLEFDLVFTDRDGNKVIPLGLSDPHADAISYLFIGKLKNDLTGADRDKLYAQVGKEISTSLTTGFASSLLSEVLTEYFRNEFGFVSSVELTYRGGGSLVESAELRLSGEIFSAYWRFGGRIFTDPTNANVSVQLSMGDVFNSTRLRNLMLQLERQVRDIQVTPQDKDTYGARLYYRITF